MARQAVAHATALQVFHALLPQGRQHVDAEAYFHRLLACQPSWTLRELFLPTGPLARVPVPLQLRNSGGMDESLPTPVPVNDAGPAAGNAASLASVTPNGAGAAASWSTAAPACGEVPPVEASPAPARLHHRRSTAVAQGLVTACMLQHQRGRLRSAYADVSTRAPTLLGGERVLWKVHGSVVLQDGSEHIGCLHVTNYRLVFMPLDPRLLVRGTP